MCKINYKTLKVLSLLLTFNISLLTYFSAFSQGAAINTNGNPADASAMLDVSSINSGILIPRMEKAQRNAIISPAEGLMIYQTNDTTGFWFYDGSNWKLLGSDAGSGLTPGSSAGNTLYWNGSSWVESSNIYNAGGSVGIGTNSPDASAAIDVSSTTKGALIPRMTTVERNAIVNPAIGLMIYNTDCENIDIYNSIGWEQLNKSNLAPTSPSVGLNIASETSIIWNWNTVSGASGYKYNTVNNYNNATDNGTNTNFTQLGLSCNTTYTLYVWGYNSCGHSFVTILNETTLPWTCGNPLTINHSIGTVAPATKTVNYGTVSSEYGGTGTKCWITQNLGSDMQATSATDNTAASAGWYWQFNRKQGYDLGPVPNWTIYLISETSDWLQGNDPCTIELGTGWRIPTKTELENADGSPQNWNNCNDTYASDLKLHIAGRLHKNTGLISDLGLTGYYWSSNQYNSTDSWGLYFSSGSSSVFYHEKSYGINIRCIQD